MGQLNLALVVVPITRPRAPLTKVPLTLRRSSTSRKPTSPEPFVWSSCFLAERCQIHLRLFHLVLQARV